MTDNDDSNLNRHPTPAEKLPYEPPRVESIELSPEAAEALT